MTPEEMKYPFFLLFNASLYFFWINTASIPSIIFENKKLPKGGILSGK
jgi:hypothetical protein